MLASRLVILPFGKNFPNFGVFLLDFTVRECYNLGMEINSVDELSAIVKNRRKKLGLTQSECAAMCNVGNRFFSELENGKESLHIGKVLNCVQMLGINLHAVNREDEG